MFKLLRYDLKCGVLERKKIMFLCIFFICMTNLYFLSQIDGFTMVTKKTVHPGWIDYMLNMYHGMKKYIPNSKQKFELPIAYFGQLILSSILIGDYVIKDIEQCGIQVLVRNQSRRNWIMSKVMWGALIIIGFYCISMVINLFFSEFRFSFDNDIAMNVIGLQTEHFHISSGLIITVIILPVLTAVTLGQIQITISLLFSPNIAFLVIMGVGLLSAYYTTPLLIGNLGMIHRTTFFLYGGIDAWMAVVIDLSIIILMLIFDFLCIRRKNILK